MGGPSTTEHTRGAEDDRWAVIAEEGIRSGHLRLLVETLDDGFDPDAGGYPQFAGIADPYRRAVVSDLIGRSAQGVADNLLEARLSAHALADLLGADGRPMPTAATGRNHIRQGAWMDLHLGAVTSGLQAAFDCLAATAIGVLRVPVPLRRAQITQVADLTAAQFSPSTPDMRRAYGDWTKLMTHHKAAPPQGWWDWLAASRHQRVHRARQNRVHIQRVREDDAPQMVVLADDPAGVNAQTARFDIHLRRRPHLADMEDFVLAPDPSDLWLAEPAEVTVAGVFDAANEFIEEAAQFLLAWWLYADKWRSCFPPPAGRCWHPAQTLGPSFDGVAPRTAAFHAAAGVAYPTLARRLSVAQTLRNAGVPPGAQRPPAS